MKETTLTPTRRSFLKSFAGAAGLACFGPALRAQDHTTKELLYRISLAEWSVNKRVRKMKGFEPLDHLDFAAYSKSIGIDAVEYVSTLFKDGAHPRYIQECRKRADDAGVQSLLIMVDREGSLGASDANSRKDTVNNHVKWLEAAQALGCHSIRVNARSSGTYSEQLRLAADGLHMLCEKADTFDLNVIVENHGGLSSEGNWLSSLARRIDHPRFGLLPDFGNFVVNKKPRHVFDPYKGIQMFMPFAKAVSAKSYDWDTGAGEFVTEGRGMKLDFLKLMKIVVDAGYRGYVGIEYEGTKHSPEEGILKTKQVLEAVREKLSV